MRLIIIALAALSLLEDLISKSAAQDADQQQQQQSSGDKMKPPAQVDHSSSSQLDDFLAALPVLNVSQRHSARFECELNVGQQLDKLVWVKLLQSRNSSNSNSVDHDVQLLSLNQRLITPDRRFSVRRQSALRWSLSLDNVSAADGRAFYLCQAGAAESSSRYVSGAKLNVLAPPKFVDEQSSGGEIEAIELEPLMLRCQVESEPRALLTWKREDGQSLESLNVQQRSYLLQRRYESNGSSSGSELEQRKLSGELTMSSFERRQSGVYLCIASNGVQPGISRRFSVSATVCFANEEAKQRRETEPCEPEVSSTTSVSTTTSSTTTERAKLRRLNGSRTRPTADKRRDKSRLFAKPTTTTATEVSIKSSRASHLIAPNCLLIIIIELLCCVINNNR